MIRKGSLFIIDSDGSYLDSQRGVLRAQDNYTSLIQVLAPFDINTVVNVNYLIYGALNETVNQYVSSTAYTGADVLPSTHSLYQTCVDWVLWEIEVSTRALTKISKYKPGQVGVSFSFKERYAPATALTYVSTFGLYNDVPASSTLGDYYVCDAYNYTSAVASLLFTKGDYAVWNGSAWTKPNQYTLVANSTTINMSVSASMDSITATELTSDEEFEIIFTEMQGDINNMITGDQVVAEATKATNDGDDNVITETYETKADATTHKEDTSNPHEVTQEQVGLGNVDNTSDADKPVSTLQAEAIDLRVPKTTTILGIDLQDNIELVEFKTAIGNATTLLSGLMSASDKQNLETLYALLAEDDGDELVNTIGEILDIFASYPEGVDIVTALATKVDKVTGSSLVADLEIAHLVALDTQAETDAKFTAKLNKLFSTLSLKDDVDDDDTIALNDSEESYAPKRATLKKLKDYMVATSGTFDPTVDYSLQGLGAYSAKVIDGTEEVEQTYTAKVNSTSGSISPINGTPELVEAKGLTLNQVVVNGDFASGVISPFTASNIGTPTVTNNIVTFTPTVQNGYLGQTLSMVNGNKYYIKARFKTTSATARVDISGEGILNHSGSGLYETLSTTFTFTGATGNHILACIEKSTTLLQIELDYAMLIPITNTPISAYTASQISLLAPTYFEGILNYTPKLSTIGKNLFDKDNATLNKYIMSDGTVGASGAGNAVTDYIRVKSNTTYIKSGLGIPTNFGAAYYDIDKNFISYLSSITTFTTPAGAEYYRFTFLGTSIDTVQLEQGTTATDYTAYNGQYIEWVDSNNVQSELLSVGSVRDILRIEQDDYVVDRYVGYDYNNVVKGLTYSNSSGDDAWSTSYLFFVNNFSSSLGVKVPSLATSINNIYAIIGTTYLGGATSTANFTTDGLFSVALSTSGQLFFNVSKTLIDAQTGATITDKFNYWINNNNITFVYEYATPLIANEIVNVNGSMIQEEPTTIVQEGTFASSVTLSHPTNIVGIIKTLYKNMQIVQDDIDDIETRLNDINSGKVFAYLSTSADTTCTTALTWYAINGTFTNDVVNHFGAATVHTPGIKYTGTTTKYFEIDYHATASGDSNGVTMQLGVKKNGTIVSGSIMSNFLKIANEPQVMSGTVVVQLETDDEIQLVVNANGSGDVVTFDYYTTTIREF